MIELLFVTCFTVTMQSTPACREQSLVFIDISVMTCMMGAQQQLALWSNEHPGQRIRSWRCRIIRPGETDA